MAAPASTPGCAGSWRRLGSCRRRRAGVGPGVGGRRGRRLAAEGAAVVWRRRTGRKVMGERLRDFLGMVTRATKLKLVEWLVECRGAAHMMQEEQHQARVVRTQHQHKQRHTLCCRGWRQRLRSRPRSKDASCAWPCAAPLPLPSLPSSSSCSSSSSSDTSRT